MPEPLWKVVQRKQLEDTAEEGATLHVEGMRTAYRWEDGPDSVPRSWLVQESKLGDLPKWLLEDVAKVVLEAELPADKLRKLNRDVEPIPEYRLGIVRYHRKGTSYEEDIVAMRFGDFKECFLR